MSTPNKTAPDFGEPWQLTTDFAFDITIREELAASFDKIEHANRAIACVNACAGMRDPAAEIQALRVALESIKSDARDLRKFKKFPESVESIACSILLKLSEITQS